MKKAAWMALLLAAAMAAGGCSVSAEPAPAPTGGAGAVNWPEERLEKNEDGVPVLDVYVVADEAVERVDVETYVEGVLAGEMKKRLAPGGAQGAGDSGAHVRAQVPLRQGEQV